MKTTSERRQPQKWWQPHEDILKTEDTLKNKDILKNKDDLKNGDDLNSVDDLKKEDNQKTDYDQKTEDNLELSTSWKMKTTQKMSTASTVLPEKIIDDFSTWQAHQNWLITVNTLSFLNRKENITRWKKCAQHWACTHIKKRRFFRHFQNFQ